LTEFAELPDSLKRQIEKLIKANGVQISPVW